MFVCVCAYVIPISMYVCVIYVSIYLCMSVSMYLGFQTKKKSYFILCMSIFMFCLKICL